MYVKDPELKLRLQTCIDMYSTENMVPWVEPKEIHKTNILTCRKLPSKIYKMLQQRVEQLVSYFVIVSSQQIKKAEGIF